MRRPDRRPSQSLAREQIVAGNSPRLDAEPSALQLAARRRRFAEPCKLARSIHEQILRHAVNRRGKTLAACAAAAQQRLVVTGHQPAVARVQLAIALEASRENSIGIEAGREERPDRGGTASVDTFGPTADFAPRVTLAERTAALHECSRRRSSQRHAWRAAFRTRPAHKALESRPQELSAAGGGGGGGRGAGVGRTAQPPNAAINDSHEVTARIRGQRECSTCAHSARSGARTCGAAVHRLVDDVRQAAPQESARPLVQCSALGIDSTNSGIGTSNAVPSSAMHW